MLPEIYKRKSKTTYTTLHTKKITFVLGMKNYD